MIREVSFFTLALVSLMGQAPMAMAKTVSTEDWTTPAPTV